jgi:hypothetical protein
MRKKAGRHWVRGSRWLRKLLFPSKLLQLPAEGGVFQVGEVLLPSLRRKRKRRSKRRSKWRSKRRSISSCFILFVVV